MILDYNKILADKETPAYLRDLVGVIQEKGGTTVGTWLKGISTFDLMAIALVTTNLAYGKTPLKDLADDPVSAPMGDYPISVLKSVAILIDVLSAAEGLDITRDTKIAIKRMFLLEKYVGYEILQRRGLNFKVLYENMSLNEDTSSPDAHATLIAPGENLVDQLEKMVDGLDSELGRIEKEMLGKSSTKLPPEEKNLEAPGTETSIKVYRYAEDGTREVVDMEDVPAHIRESILKSFQAAPEEERSEIRTVAVHVEPEEDKPGLRNRVATKVYSILEGVLSWVGKFRKAKIQGKMES